MPVWKKYGFAWVTLALFVASVVAHWGFGWVAYADEQTALGQPIDVNGYLIEMARDTFENWQSEFLQLLWQICALAYLLYVGSPQSKEEDDRLEEKLDAILRRIDPDHAQGLIDALDRRFPGRYVGPKL
jgi:hypothetical protein